MHTNFWRLKKKNCVFQSLEKFTNRKTEWIWLIIAIKITRCVFWLWWLLRSVGRGGWGWGGSSARTPFLVSKRFYIHHLIVHSKCPTVWNSRAEPGYHTKSGRESGDPHILSWWCTVSQKRCINISTWWRYWLNPSGPNPNPNPNLVLCAKNEVWGRD